jgi:hypothetical protein
VQAARDALNSTQDARQLAALQAAIPAAQSALADVQSAQYDLADPAAAKSHAASVEAAVQSIVAAQASLSDFLAQQNIDALEADARVKIDALDLQKKANDDAAKVQTDAENARYEAQTKAYDAEMTALQTYLDKHPVAWKATSDKVLAFLVSQGVTYAAAGAGLGKAFADGLKTQEQGIVSSAQSFGKASALEGKASGGPVSAGRAYVVGERGPEVFIPGQNGSIATGGGGGTYIAPGAIVVSGTGDPEATARAVLLALRREVSRQGMSLS